MKLNHKNAAKLASLSALGIGAVIVGAEDAQASVVYTAVPAGSGEVGFLLGSGGSYVVKLSGANKFAVDRTGFSVPLMSGDLKVRAFPGIGTEKFAGLAGRVTLFAKSVTAPATSFGVQTGTIAQRTWTMFKLSAFGDTGGEEKYALFSFQCPSGSPTGTCYGWVGLTAVATPGNIGTEPDVNIIGYAYDTTASDGVLAAGNTGPSSVPEPDTFALTGLAALALGAVGVRRWRAARRAKLAR